MSAWWKSAVVYQIYPRSFADGNGDGVGDLAGLSERLDHIASLGVDAVWLSPIFPSPMRDFGYDVSDYCDVDPVFGTLAELDDLVARAHERGLRVLLDWVPNHTSDQHPWFVESRSSRDNPKRDWYVWRDGGPDKSPPNNWIAAFTNESAWAWDEMTEQWYLHLFLPAQPDLNWSNPEVRDAMHDVLRFWLDRGIDGFRMDVVHCIGKNDDLADDPPQWRGVPHSAIHECDATHTLLRGIRGVLDEYDGDRMAIGEVYLIGDEITRRTARYIADENQLHLAFNFAPLFARWDAARFEHLIVDIEEHFGTPRWPTWVLSNHDNRRHRTRYKSEARARAAAVMLLTIRGTPFLYAGEELGLEDAVIPPEAVVDPGGRDGCRAPVPWTRATPHGWGEPPWLPFPPYAEALAVEAQRDDPRSMLHLYRRLLAARRASPALSLGDLTLSTGLPDGVVGWERIAGDDWRRVLVNFTSSAVRVHAEGIVEVSSDGVGEGHAFTGQLGADQAVVLRS